MIILGIETSCDETAIAILKVSKNKIDPAKSNNVGAKLFGRVKVLSNTISSQVKLHAPYGGVVPYLAAREHEKNLPRVLKESLKEARIPVRAGFTFGEKEIDLIVVTKGPGLSPALWRGVDFAKKISEKNGIPLIGANHLEGHVYSNWLSHKIDKKLFPILNLIVSGGHTQLVLMKNYGKYNLIGETLDDAAGEAFDKIARVVGLGYPGGLAVSMRADKFNGKKNIKAEIIFPRPMIHTKDFNFSFSGLKTAVLYKVRDLEKRNPPSHKASADKVKLTPALVNEICFEAQNAIVDVLLKKSVKATKKYKINSFMLSGGVSANKLLRSRLEEEFKKLKIHYFQPELKFTGDNAAMIALAGYMNYKKNPKITKKIVSVDANLKLK